MAREWGSNDNTCEIPLVLQDLCRAVRAIFTCLNKWINDMLGLSSVSSSRVDLIQCFNHEPSVHFSPCDDHFCRCSLFHNGRGTLGVAIWRAWRTRRSVASLTIVRA